jgi:flagellar basal-body rod protein FlgC
MTDSLRAAMHTASSGMRTQGVRTRVVTENLANAETTGLTPGSDPYRRRLVGFESFLDAETGSNKVRVKEVFPDPSDFRLVYNPNHPAANGAGYFKAPNVNSLIEMTDLRESQRTYEANLNAMSQARAMISRTIDLLR